MLSTEPIEDTSKSWIVRVGSSPWLTILIAAAILIPRSLAIAAVHSESYDDEYHVRRGLAFLTGTIIQKDLILNDPPLGEGLIALPIYLVNRFAGAAQAEYGGEGEPLSRESVELILAAWKSILFCPAIGLAFHWCRRLYGLRSAWMAAAILLFEPTFAAHVPIPALDVLGAEAILLSCYLAWEFGGNPSARRAVGVGAAVAMSLMIKHTSIILPGVVVAFVGLGWLRLPWLASRDFTLGLREFLGRARSLALLAVSSAFFLWAFTFFDVRTPPLFFDKGVVRSDTSHPEAQAVS